MKKKKILVLLMSVFVMFNSQALTTLAIDGNCDGRGIETLMVPGRSGVSPMYTDAKRFSALTYVSGRSVVTELSVTTKNGNVQTSGTMYLDIYNGRSWDNIAAWPVSGRSSFSTSRAYPGTSGRKYRARVVINIGSDSINHTTNTVTYN